MFTFGLWHSHQITSQATSHIWIVGKMHSRQFSSLLSCNSSWQQTDLQLSIQILPDHSTIFLFIWVIWVIEKMHSRQSSSLLRFTSSWQQTDLQLSIQILQYHSS